MFYGIQLNWKENILDGKNQTLKIRKFKNKGNNSLITPHLPMRHFYSWFVWSWQCQQGSTMESRDPSSAAFSPCCEGRSERDQGWWPEGMPHSAIGHYLSCKPANPNHLLCWSAASVSRDQTTPCKEKRVTEKFSFALQKKPPIKIVQILSSKVSLFLLTAHSNLMDWLCIHAEYEYETSQQV